MVGDAAVRQMPAPDGHGTSPQKKPYTRRTTDDRDEAEQFITELYLPNRLDLSPGSAPLEMDLSGLRLGALTAGRLSYGRMLRLRTADAENFHVNLPVRGRAVSRRGSGEPVATSPGGGLIFSPGAPAEISWSADCEQLCLMIPRGCLEAELEHLLGRTLGARLSFDFQAELQRPVGRRLQSVLDLVIDELDSPTDFGTNPVVGRHVESLVLDGLLLGQPHNHSELASRPGRGVPGAAIRHAVEIIEERPGEPWSTVRLATEVHMSVRALQEGFSRDLGTPPMTYLRQVRLRRAYDALRSSMRDATTVRAVAMSLGLMHMGRFAAAYRDTFGEAPSETLSRHPS